MCNSGRNALFMAKQKPYADIVKLLERASHSQQQQQQQQQQEEEEAGDGKCNKMLYITHVMTSSLIDWWVCYDARMTS